MFGSEIEPFDVLLALVDLGDDAVIQLKILLEVN